MQSTSSLYKQILANPRHTAEVKVNIAGVDYDQSRIVSMSTTAALFSTDSLSAGGAVAGEIDLVLYKPDTIPKMAKLIPYYRLVLGTQVSEWIQKGVYYIDTREPDGDTLVIHGFDDMLKAEQVWVPDQSLTFPMPMTQAINLIAEIMGVTIDSRTSLNTTYMLDYPANDYTLRDILRYVAAANAGNWIMSDTGQLWLVSLNQLPTETNYLVTETGDAITIGGDRILVG